MSRLSIRQYKSTDREGLVRCLLSLQDLRVSLDEKELLKSTDSLAQDTAKALGKHIMDKTGATFIIADGETIHGCGSCYIRELDDTEYNQARIGVIHKVYLDEHLRGRGFGKKLFTQLEAYLREYGCKYTTLDVSVHNPAHAMYSRLGYNDRTRSMIKEL